MYQILRSTRIPLTLRKRRASTRRLALYLSFSAFLYQFFSDLDIALVPTTLFVRLLGLSHTAHCCL